MKKLIAILFALFCLNSCTISNYYVEPNQGHLAAISSGYRASNGNWDEARILAIDNKYVASYNQEDLFGYPIQNRKIPVTAGEHRFFILTTIHRSYLTNDSRAYSLLQANIIPNGDYQVREFLMGPQVKVWITDQNGSVVSPMVLSEYHQNPARAKYVPLLLK